MRQSTRFKDKPASWSDYHVSTHLTFVHPYGPVEQVYLTSSYTEPSSHHQAVIDLLLRETMEKELHALNFNNTRTSVPLPEGKKIIRWKWVTKLKL